MADLANGIFPSSKSIVLRLEVIRSFSGDPAFEIIANVQSDDVLRMQQGLSDLRKGKEVYCGLGAAVFRFLILHASRIPGKHVVAGEKQLLQRPHSPLIDILNQLGAKTERTESRWTLISEGWKKSAKPISIDVSFSSQFASAVLLSAWGLEFPLILKWEKPPLSRGYFDLTVDLVRNAGMQIRIQENGIEIPPGQVPAAKRYLAELDLSCCFAAASVWAIKGGGTIDGYPDASLQPDRIFPDFLESLGVQIHRERQRLTIHPGKTLKPIRADLSSTPDLFPSLSILCALAEGESHLTGAPHLALKESNRIEQSSELIQLMGRQWKTENGGLKIVGKPFHPKDADRQFRFDPHQDHRMAMAAAVAMKAGFPVDLITPQVVRKSFAHFWEAVDLKP